ncbi:MAG: OmpA family protein, partial [Verrucomicrobiales bacterium]
SDNPEEALERAKAARDAAGENASERGKKMREQARTPSDNPEEALERAKAARDAAGENASERGKKMREQARTPSDNPEEALERAKAAREAAGENASERGKEMRERGQARSDRPEGAEPAEGRGEKMRERAQADSDSPEEDAVRAQARTEVAESEEVVEAQREREERRRESREVQTEETARVLEGRGDRDRRDRRDFEERARRLDDDDDARDLITAMLAGGAAGAIAGHLTSRDDDREFRRLSVEHVGRTSHHRRESVDYLTRRFRGQATLAEAPDFYASPYYRAHRRHGSYHYQPHFYNERYRVVHYPSHQVVPPILLASQQLNHVEIVNWGESAYYDSPQPQYYSDLPQAYREESAVALAYEVDPDSAVVRDDILFEQGSTALADAYSYDLIADIAEAIGSSELQNEQFVIEGHASAEGDYAYNLGLSQQRAERIARDLVDMGVAPERLLPVGYGEGEAVYPANAPESQRALDRRVMVFRMDR